MTFQKIQVSPDMKANLMQRLVAQSEFMALRENPLLAGLITCLGIVQEVGTINDELCRHLLDRPTGESIDLESAASKVRIFILNTHTSPTYYIQAFLY